MNGIEGFVVIVMFSSEIDLSFGIGVIIHPIGSGAVFADIERKILIKRVAVFRSEAHGVICIQLEALMVLIDSSGLVSQPVDLLILFSSRVMDRAFSQFSVKVVS